MVPFQRVCLLVGGTAAALMATSPAQADEGVAAILMTESSDLKAAPAKDKLAQADVTGYDMENFLAQVAEEINAAESATASESASVQSLDDYLATDKADTPAASTSADAFFTETEVVVSDVTETSAQGEAVAQSEEVAQVTRPLYRGVSPFYVGIGGNIGIIDSSTSGVGDFGFNVISKISLGPRFAVRPSVQISEDNFNITLPVTFNFNPVELGRFSVYPSVGGGVDFGDDIGLLVNGGLDVPISRDFTFNSQVNWRVTNRAGLGVSLGVGYNFPLFFE